MQEDQVEQVENDSSILVPSSRSPRKQFKSAMLLDNVHVHGFDFKSPGDYLRALLRKQVMKSDDTSFGAEIFPII